MIYKYVLGFPYILFWSVKDYLSRDLKWCDKEGITFKRIFMNNWNYWVYLYAGDDIP